MRSPTEGLDYTNKDYEAFRTMMIDNLQEKIPTYTDTSQSDAGIVLIEGLAKGLDIISYNQDTNANEVYLSTSEQLSSINMWCGTLGYVPTPATPSVFKQVFKLSVKQSTPVTIPKGTLLKTASTSTEKSIYFETAQALTLPVGVLGDEQDLVGAYTYSVDAIQGYTVNTDSIGKSNGTANQVFKLSNKEALPNTLVVNVFNGLAYDEWTLVDSFIDSKATSKHFRITQDEDVNTYIIFGDNFTSAIPPSSNNPIYATYRVGGGVKGNVSPNTITLMETSSSFISKTFNPFVASTRGTDKESKESIKVNAPTYNRVRWGLLREEDYKGYIAMEYPNEILATSVVKDATDPLLLHIGVLPQPSHTLEELTVTLTADLLDRRIVGSRFDIISPKYKNFDLTLSLIVLDYYNQLEVKNAVSQYIISALKLGNYTFGAEVVFSILCGKVMNSVEGIKSLRVINPADDVLAPASDEILNLGTVTVNAIGGAV